MTADAVPGRVWTTFTEAPPAMSALVADKTAPATAREYGQYYNVRDAGDKSLQSMDSTLIQSSCP